MCHSPLHPFLAALPKCEHHIHIEGSLTPPTLFALAARNNITLPSPANLSSTNPAADAAYSNVTSLELRYESFTSLDDFLHYYYIGMSVLLHPTDFADLALTYLRKAHADGVRHAEIFFDPQAHVARGVSFSTVLSGLRAGCAEAEKECGVSSLLICCFLRHLPVSETVAAWGGAELQTAIQRGEVAGIGLDSSEAPFPARLFESVWREAREAGVKCTMHAGEEGAEGVRNIETALFELGCERVDHGIQLARDPALMARVAEKGALLTVCPLSNVALRGVQSVSEVPIRTFLDNGVRFSINSDDPAYFGGFILENYCRVQEAFGLGRGDWVRIAEWAIEGSWCGEGRKEVLRGELREVESRFA